VSAARPAKVFVVDAHPLLREGVRRRVEGDGSFDVVGEAASAAEALAALEAGSADILVIDPRCFDVVGEPVAAALARISACAAVVVLSQDARPREVSDALRAGARAYVLKGSRADRVLEAIRAVASGGTFLDDGIAPRMLEMGSDTVNRLTAREQQVLALIGRGESSKAIARALHISVRTVESHRQSVKRKLGVEGMAALIKYAVEQAAHGPAAHSPAPPWAAGARGPQ
jgi:DNA-binding NarL/FixJ family response regulator